VRRLGSVDAAEVIAEFLRGEIESPRFRDALLESLAEHDTDESLIRQAQLDDEQENALRARVLERFRGDYLGSWLHELAWFRAELEPDEVLAVRYIAWDSWLEITGGSRLPADGAAYLRRRGEGARYGEGSPPLIVVRADPSSHLVVLEGHVRLTALAMNPEAIPRPLAVIVGEGEAVRPWDCY